MLILTLHPYHCIHFLRALNKKSTFDLVNVIVKVRNISPAGTIADAIEQTLHITKASAFDNTSSIRINFYHDLAEVPLNNKKYNITYLQIHNYISERLLKTTERMKIETDEVTKINTKEDFVNTESNADNTKVISVDQKTFRKLFIFQIATKK